MKKSCLFLAALLSISALRSPAGLVLQPNDMLAITGDSITAQHYYSAILEDYLIMCQPTPGLSVAQFGWAGETARPDSWRGSTPTSTPSSPRSSPPPMA